MCIYHEVIYIMYIYYISVSCTKLCIYIMYIYYIIICIMYPVTPLLLYLHTVDNRTSYCRDKEHIDDLEGEIPNSKKKYYYYSSLFFIE